MSSRTRFCSWLSLYIGRPLNRYTKPMLMFPKSGDKIMVVSVTTGFPCRNRAYGWNCGWQVGSGCVKLQSTHWSLWSFFCPLFACSLGSTWTKIPDLRIKNICAPGVRPSAEASSLAWSMLSKGWRQHWEKLATSCVWPGYHALGFVGILF